MKLVHWGGGAPIPQAGLRPLVFWAPSGDVRLTAKPAMSPASG